MKRLTPQRSRRLALWGMICLGSACTLRAQTPYTIPAPREPASKNRFSFGYRVGLNIGVNFENVGGFSSLTMPNFTPNGDAYNYDDGYVLPDISGSGVDTWYWGYESGADPTGITLHRSSAEPVEASFDDLRESPELAYWRSVGSAGDGHWGWLAAFNYTRIDNKRRGPFNLDAQQRTDTFTSPTPPPPAAPYFGTFQGPVPGGPSRPLLPLNPTSSSTTFSRAMFEGTHRYEADLFGFKLGPYIVVPLAQRLSLDLSGGLALGVVNSDYKFEETVTLPSVGSMSSRGSSSRSDVVFGGFASADLWYMVAHDFGVFLGMQYQYLQDSTHTTEDKKTTLELNASFFLSVGFGYAF